MSFISFQQAFQERDVICTPAELKERLLLHCEKLDMNGQEQDVAKLLFNPNDVCQVVVFPDVINQKDLC